MMVLMKHSPNQSRRRMSRLRLAATEASNRIPAEIWVSAFSPIEFHNANEAGQERPRRDNSLSDNY